MGLNLIGLSPESRKEKAKFMDKDGYLYSLTIAEEEKSKGHKKFYKFNPYTIYNIRLFINKNKIPITLLSEKYVSSTDGLLCRCNKCNHLWKISSSNLLRGKGCPECAWESRSKKRRFNNSKILKIIEENNSFVDVDLTEYKNMRSLVNCKCKICGNEWKSVIRAICKGAWCPDCRSVGSYSLKNMIRQGENNVKVDTNMYVIKCWNEEEEFYKIGITKNIKVRFKTKRDMPYEYKILFLKKKNAYDVVFAEYILHQNLKKYSYIPKIHFGGKYECFSFVDMKEVEEVFNNVKSNKMYFDLIKNIKI